MSQNDKIQIINEVQKALDSIEFGSIEVFMQAGIPTQVTIKKIQKTGISVKSQANNLQAQNSHFYAKNNHKTKTGLSVKLGT